MGTELTERRVDDPYGSDEMTPERAAWLIVKSYPNRPDKDGDAYIRQVSVLLASFPEWVRRKAVHPNRGIIGQCKWPPTAYELREFCNAEMERAARAQRAEEERKRLPEPEPEVTAEERAERSERLRKVSAEIRAATQSMDVTKTIKGVQRPGDEHAGILNSQIYLDHIAEKESEDGTDVARASAEDFGRPAPERATGSGTADDVGR